MAPEGAPETIGRYELITRIATGGTASIFLARERGVAGFERFVVIKRILPHLVDKPHFVDMIVREARITARLSHPNVVQIHDLGEEQGLFYIAFEYIHGCTVRELQVMAAKKGVTIPIDVTLCIMAEACRGAHAAHKLEDAEGNPIGLVHRDLSPQNLMLTRSGHLKILDFGIAKVQRGQEVTTSGDLKGKYAYMSPEQARHDPLDLRSDLFSLGTIFWELCTGKRLFKRRNELATMQAIIDGDIAPPSLYQPELPEVVSQVIDRALEVKREMRFSTGEEMRRAILDAAQHSGIILDTDRVGQFLLDVAGERLAERDAIIEKAKREGLSQAEGKRLQHTSSDYALMSSSISISSSISGDGSISISQSVSRTGDPNSSISLITGEPLITEPEEATSTSAPRKSPRWPLLLVALVLLGLGGGGAWFFLNKPPQAEGKPEVKEEQATEPAYQRPEGPLITIGWPPTLDVEVLTNELEPLRRHLEQGLQRPVEFVFTEDYGDLRDRVLSGELAYGRFPPLLYVRTISKSLRVRPVVGMVFDGAKANDGYLLVRHVDGIEHLDMLKGKRFCFTDENSTTGYFLPRAYLKAQGLVPEEFIGEVHWSGSHHQVMRDLLRGKCDAAATYSGAYFNAGRHGVASSQLRVLAITGHIPQDVIVAGPAAVNEEADAIREVLLRFESDGGKGEVTGFVLVDIGLFETLKEIVEADEKP